MIDMQRARRPKTKRYTVQMCFRLRAEDAAGLQKIADDQGEPVSEVARAILTAELRKRAVSRAKGEG